MFALVVAIIFTLAALELSYRLLAFAIVWLAPALAAVFVAVVISQAHVSDPMMSVWVFMAIALIGRFVIGRIKALASLSER
jgi:hypothetical protein